MFCAMDPSFLGLYKASWHHHILDNALRIPVCGLIRMVYEMTENWYFLFWVFSNNKKQIDNKKRLVNTCIVQRCNGYRGIVLQSQFFGQHLSNKFAGGKVWINTAYTHNELNFKEMV